MTSQPQPDVSAAYRRYRCRDGWLLLACASEAHWKALAKAVGRPELAYPHSWEAASKAPPDGPLAQLLESIFAADPVAVWLQRLQAHGVPVSSATPPAPAALPRAAPRRPGPGLGHRVE